ncbi:MULTISPECIES: AAA family ATPase [unclassified Curtobacterium]|uniref:ATP-dependent nuclease n=1 Tax=unclassified Curtobacterium TaxID=257496 RepID=UPI000DAA305D|nr:MULTISPECIES: AAA family ATPase [unclassified Curtobacterium]WIB32970.1 AAA family ATPase [Curtobacterium sp. MCSS17_005]WIE83357.1 AAA family ATPase [Curtobacterium sp. MCPF17_021]
MRLSRITIKNYSRVADLDVPVGNHLVVVGANDVGKTSILRALNLALGAAAQLYQSLSVQDLADAEQPMIVSAHFVAFSEAERAVFYREIDIDATSKAEALEVRLEVRVDPDDPESILITRWSPGRGEVRPITREQLAAIGWRYLPAARQASAAQLESPAGAVKTLLRALEPELGDEKSALGEILSSFNSMLATSVPLGELLSGVAERLSDAMPRTIASEDLAVRTVADPTDSVLDGVSLFTRSESGFSPISEQSDGIRQLIAMTLFDLAEGAANVIAIDEPEIHLHPSSQRTVADLLASDRNQKVIVTHSPYIVQKFDPTEVIAVDPNGESHYLDPTRTRIEERVQAHWWSPRMLEALTARFVIAVEGVADRLIVEAAARALGISLDRIGATVFELGGAENFPVVHKLLGPSGFGIDVLGLVDDAEKGKWVGAVGGRPRDVLERTVFVSKADLEDEYCRALGAEAMTARLIDAGVARDVQTLLAACGVADDAALTPSSIAKYCRTSGGQPRINRKVPAALAVAKRLNRDEVSRMDSVNALLAELARRAVE